MPKKTKRRKSQVIVVCSTQQGKALDALGIGKIVPKKRDVSKLITKIGYRV